MNHKNICKRKTTLKSTAASQVKRALQIKFNKCKAGTEKYATVKHSKLNMGSLEHTAAGCVVTLLWDVRVTAGTNSPWSEWCHLWQIWSIFQRRAARKDAVMGWEWAGNSRLGTLDGALGQKMTHWKVSASLLLLLRRWCSVVLLIFDLICLCTDGEKKKFSLQIDG